MLGRSWIITLIILALPACSSAQQPTPEEQQPLTQLQGEPAEITRSPDGQFSIQILGIPMNEGSTMQRESIVLNVPDSPVRFTSASMSFDYEDRRFQYNVAAQLEAAVPIAALEVRHVLFDLFGEHMQNLSNTDATDITPGNYSMDGTWNILRDNAVTEHLTTVSFVAQARLENGRVWKFDSDVLSASLRSLNLDQEVEDDPDQN